MKGWIILLALLVILSACTLEETDELDIITDYETTTVMINGIQIKAQIADTQDKRSQGLMYRDELVDYEGMLFIFEDEQERVFWMKNTWISLDIIFIDVDKEIINIVTSVPCEQDDCPLYTSELPAKYVLEVRQGFAQEFGIEEGMKVEF